MPLKIYNSSAGSGKTYTLTKEYLKLILPGKKRDYFRHILAVTFTNKATAEMKERIVKALHMLSREEDPGLADILSGELGLEKDQIRTRAGECLHDILHGYSNFSVSTIDSFFQGIIRSFARETGLNMGYKVEMDEGKVLEEVADRLLVKVGANQVLTEWLVQFVTEQIEAGKSWEIKHSIKSLAGELFKERFKVMEDQVLTEGFEKKLLGLRKELRDIRSSLEGRMNALGREALTLVDSFGLEIKDFAYKSGGPAGYFVSIADGKSFDDFEPKLRPRKAAEQNTGWFSKDSEYKDQIQEAVDNGLHRIISEAVRLWDESKEEYATACEVLRNLYTFGILHHIASGIRQYRDDHEVLLISDTSQLLDRIIANNDSPFIYEKTGNRYNHFLIDEFQDTSGFQWSNLKPLLINSLSSDHYSMIVGDVKQSIYRFRGGDWKLLMERAAADLGTFSPGRSVLNDNWRSRTEVILFNNSFFRAAPALLKEKFLSLLEQVTDPSLRQELSGEASCLQMAYGDSEQSIPLREKKQGGYINLTFFKEEAASEEENAEGGPDWKGKVGRRLPLLVEELQDKGVRLKDIAFLVRTKKEGVDIVNLFNDYCNSKAPASRYRYDIVSSESLEMGSSRTLDFIVTVISWLHNPANRIVKARLLYLFFSLRKEKDFPVNEMFVDSLLDPLFSRSLPPQFLERTVYLSRLSLFELVEQIILIFDLSARSHEHVFLQFFQDAVLEFSGGQKASLSSFLEWWEETGRYRSVIVSEQQDAMKIVTLHKSKGLQYNVVIMPYCSWTLEADPTKNNILWCGSAKPPFDRFPGLPVRFSSTLKNSFYSREYYREMLMSYTDNLNLLYVAFTRAVDRLYVFAPFPRANKDGSFSLKRVNDLIFQSRQLISGPAQRITETAGSLVIEQGPEGADRPAGVPVTDTGSYTLRSFPVSDWRHRLSIAAKSPDLFVETASPSALKINYGIIMHRVLSEIAAPADIPGVLENLCHEGLISSSEKRELNGKLDVLFGMELVKEWFSPNWTSRNECEILLPDGGICRPDKVLIKGDRAVVIDFKTGEEREEHRRQILSYAGVLGEMGYREISAYLVYLEDFSIKKLG